MLLKCFSTQKESKKRFVFMAGGEGPDPKATAEAAEAKKEAIKAKLPGETVSADVLVATAMEHIEKKTLDSGDTKNDRKLKDVAEGLIDKNAKEFQDTVAYAGKRAEVLAIAGTDKAGVNIVKTDEINDDGALQTETGYLQKLKDFKALSPDNAEIKADHDNWNKLLDAKINDIQKQIDGYYERTITMYPDELIGKLNQQTQITDLTDFTALSSEIARIEGFRKEHFPNSTDGAKAKLDGIGKNKITDINRALAAAADKVQDPALKEQAKNVVDAMVNVTNATNYNLEGKDKDKWLPGAEMKADMTMSRMMTLTNWQNLVKAAPGGLNDPALKPYMKDGAKYADWTKAEDLAKAGEFAKAKVAYDNIAADYYTVLDGFTKQKEAADKENPGLLTQINTLKNNGDHINITVNGQAVRITKMENGGFQAGELPIDQIMNAKTAEEAIKFARELALRRPPVTTDTSASDSAPDASKEKKTEVQEVKSEDVKKIVDGLKYDVDGGAPVKIGDVSFLVQRHNFDNGTVKLTTTINGKEVNENNPFTFSSEVARLINEKHKAVSEAAPVKTEA